MSVRLWVRSLLALTVVAAGVLGWGCWYSSRHASTDIRVDDHALKTRSLSYGSPHGVSITLRDASGAPLAAAHSVEPLGYILAAHPSTAIGDCRQYGHSPSEYATCFDSHSRWSSTWAPRVRVADVAVGACRLRSVPVDVSQSNADWALWWVPLPHIGGLPRRHFSFSVALDSQACTSVPSAPAATGGG